MRWPAPAAGRAAASCLLLALAAGAVGQRAPTESDLEAVRAVVAALHAADGPGLAALVDFERRTAERIERGDATRPWEDLDALDRQLERRTTAEAWMAQAGDFLRAVSLVGVTAVEDPDAGLGPVPDRRILQAVLRRLVGGEHRDLLVVLAPDDRVLDLVFGPPYFAGANPAGEDGLLPRSRLVPPSDRQVRWPDDVDAFERGKLEELVDRLLELPEGYDRDLVVEQLHRSPRNAVACLLERLLALDAAGADVDRQGVLDAVLRHITGRPSRFRTAPRPGQDLDAMRATNSAVVAAWLRWQVEDGARFPPTPIVPPLDPTVAEKAAGDTGGGLARWDEVLQERGRLGEGAPAEDAGGDVPAVAPTSPAPPTAGGPRAGEPAGGPEGAGPAPMPAAPPRPPSAPRPPAPTGPAPVPGGAATRMPPQRATLFPAAADAIVRVDGRARQAREIETELTPALIEALNAWTESAAAMSLEILLARPYSSGLVVLAHAPQDLARDAVEIMGRTHALLDGLLPAVPESEATAVLAIVLDEDAVAVSWRPLLDHLVAERLLLGNQAARLQSDPQGVLLRKVPMFLQPTWDIAAEGEFALGNEIAHKTAQCLVTQRAGELPMNLLWGLGELAEQQLYGNVYQFNATGFVATADHFDWPQRARQHIENRYRKPGFTFSALALDDRQAGIASLPQMVTWAVLAHLADEAPATLKSVLAELGALHAAQDRSGRATLYRGDAERTRAVLQEHFDALDPERVMSWLRSRR
jgi:hypothetical protein